MIVVTGSTGNVGGEAARILAESRVPLRLLARNEARVSHFSGAEVSIVDYAEPEKLAEALHPGDRVFMVSVYEGHDERLGKHKLFVDAAAAADVGQLVYLSFINAAADAPFVHAVSHFETEEMIKAAGLPYTFLRTSLYQASVPWFFEEDACRAPAGDGLASWVSRRDVGAAVAAVLRQDGHVGQTYNLTGPEAISMEQTVERVNGLIGTELRYEDVDDYKGLAVRGLPDPVAMKESRHSCFVSIAAGTQALVTDDVQRLTGVTASSIDRHALNYPEQFGWAPSAR